MKIDKNSLLCSQQQLINKGYLESNSSWIICAPTGAGKTRMGEWALQKAATNGLRGVYLAPLKAIVEEKKREWEKGYPEFIMGLFTGETTRKTSQKSPKNEQWLLMTSEKLSSYLNNWKYHINWLSEIEVVVIDEFHLMSDPSRGRTVESLIGRIQRINPFVRFIALSATIPNTEKIASWLQAEAFVTEWRPVPLSHRIVKFRKPAEKIKLLITEVKKTTEQDGQVLVFVNSRRRSEHLAAQLMEAGFRADFYHAGLDSDHRQLRHQSMHQKRLDALISTSSLEMGVNFPARKVVVYDSYLFDGDRFGPIGIGRYLQFAGRAGRPGLDPTGEAVLFLPIWHKNPELYMTGIPEPVVSGLAGKRALEKEVMTEISTRLSISTAHLDTNFMSRSFLKLINAELLRKAGEKQEYLTATSLGRVATQMDVSPETIQILDNFFYQVPNPSRFDCLLSVCLCPELSPKLPFNFEQIDELGGLLTQIPSHLLDSKPERSLSLYPHQSQNKTLLASLKTALILMEHTTGDTLEELARRFDCYPLDISIIKKNAEWIFATASRVFAIRRRQEWYKKNDKKTTCPPSIHEMRINQLGVMIRHGLPLAACQLVNIRGIGPRRAMALYQQGVTSLAGMAETPIEKISHAIRLKTELCKKMKEDAMNHLSKEKDDRLNFFLEETPPAPLNMAINNWPEGVDPYRLRRSLDLQVTFISKECVRVEGGTEPHAIKINLTAQGFRHYVCDCADAVKGNLCKHVMRAKLEYGDGPELLYALKVFQHQSNLPFRYSVRQLWAQGAQLYALYEDKDGNRQGTRFLGRNAAAMRWSR
jgi:helicase